jgi:hypothetical protein
MGTFSDHLQNEVLDHVFKTGVYTAATNLFVALLKSTPDEDSTGSSLPSEITGTDYARVTCNTWDAASAGATENSQPTTWAQAGGDWGIVTHFCVMDGITTGNQIAWGKLGAARTISSGDTARFATGDLDVTLT